MSENLGKAKALVTGVNGQLKGVIKQFGFFLMAHPIGKLVKPASANLTKAENSEDVTEVKSLVSGVNDTMKKLLEENKNMSHMEQYQSLVKGQNDLQTAIDLLG